MENVHPDVESWLDEISDARKREKDFLDKGKEILDIYNGCYPDKIPYNVLYSNTETLLPALYSNTPRPVVRPRFKNKDRQKLSQAASQAAERMLSYLMDCNMTGYESFDTVIQDAVMDGLLPGRGDISVRYDEKGTEGDIYDMEYELAYLVSNKWNRIYYGYSTKWSEVPWKAYELFIDKDEAKRLFGNKKANKLIYTEGEQDDEQEENHQDDLHQGKRKTCLVYQIWDTSDSKVKYIAPSFKDGILKTVDDPLELSGFIDSPRPLQFVRKSNDLVPTALYVLYENQAKELNRITFRLKRIVEAIKVRGAYNGKFGDIFEQILDEDDNGFVPTDEGAALLDGAMDKSIWMLPVSELMAVAQQLLQAREATKSVIYEITGISDILRGSSMASETLGAQKIKEAWGTMRLKRLQKDVQSFVKESLRMLLEVACNKFSDESWINMTGLPFLTEQQFQQAQNDIQRAQMMIAQNNVAQQQGQQPNPSVQQQAEQITQTAQLALQQPRWAEIFPILRDKFTRSYLIDIETNSTLDSEATEDQKNIAEFMNALAQFMNGAMPMVQQGVLPFEAMKSMLLAVTQRFRFGHEVEEEIKKMAQPQQNPEEAQKQVQEMQKQVQKAQQDVQKQKQQLEAEIKKAGEQLDDEFNKLELQKQEFEFQKKLFAEEQKFNEKLAQMKLDMDQKDAENEIKKLIDDHKREVQSMNDKQVNNLKMMLNEAMNKPEEKQGKEEKVIVVQAPAPSKKKISLNRENGQLTGADVEEIYEGEE